MQKQLLIIAFAWPEPNSTAAGNRMLQLIHFFLEQEYKITVASTAVESEHSLDLDALGAEKASIQLNHSSFDDFVTKLNPKIVLFDRFLTEEQFGWRVAKFAPNAIRLLDTEDLHSLRQTRQVEFKNNRTFTTAAWLQNDTTKREVASIYRCDVSLIISSYEMILLAKTLKIDPSLLLYLPFMLPKINRDQVKNWTSFDDRKDFIFIGNGKHAPNVDAVVWLKEKIWPKIRNELPKTQLHVYGAYLPQRIKEMQNSEKGFLIKGWVADAKKVMCESKVSFAPLRYGAGIKGKLILAMQTGTPSITTSIGAEGMHKGLPWSGTVTNNADEFAKAAIDLYNNKNKWYMAQQSALTIINSLYRKEKLHDHLNRKINDLQLNLPKHRAQNFMGALLQHQTMQSTKYLSKWIEEKNSKV